MAQTALPAPQARRSAAGPFFGLFDADGWAWAGRQGALLVRRHHHDARLHPGPRVLLHGPARRWTSGRSPRSCSGRPSTSARPRTRRCRARRPAGRDAARGTRRRPRSSCPPGAPTARRGRHRHDVHLRRRQDGSRARRPTSTSRTPSGLGNLDKWSEGPALPEARTDAASVVLGNTLYVIGGFGPDGKPTTTHRISLTVNNDGTLGKWTTEDALALPEPRAGATAVTVSDGIVVMGGTDGTGRHTSVWKSQQSTAAPLAGAWARAVAAGRGERRAASAAHVGDVIFVHRRRQRPGPDRGHGPAGPGRRQCRMPRPRTPTSSAPVAVQRADQPARAAGELSGFIVRTARSTWPAAPTAAPAITETLWATPDANGVIPTWNHLPQIDLGQGIAGLRRRRLGRVRVPRRRHDVGRCHRWLARAPTWRRRSRSSSWACSARRSRLSS